MARKRRQQGTKSKGKKLTGEAKLEDASRKSRATGNVAHAKAYSKTSSNAEARAYSAGRARGQEEGRIAAKMKKRKRRTPLGERIVW